MDAMICPDKVQKELNLYCMKEKARERSEEEIWKGRKENDPHAHLHGLCRTHVYTCETKRDVLFPVAWLVFPILLAAALSTVGINWPAFAATHPWWLVCVVLPLSTVVTYEFANWFTVVAVKCYAKMVFARCKECRENYCAPHLLQQEKKRGLRSKVVAMIIRDWDDVRETFGLIEGAALARLHIDWDDYDERIMVKHVFQEIAKSVPGFVFAMNKPSAGTYRLMYSSVSAPKT